MSNLRDQLDPDRLLDHADRLIAGTRSDPRGRPVEIDLRRAVSASYYAAFHAVSLAVTTKVFGSSSAAREYAVRWINHDDIAGASRLVSTYSARPQLDPSWGPERAAVWQLLAASPPSTDVVAIASSFLALREQRHRADYDRSRRVTKSESVQAAADARALVGRVSQLSDSVLSSYLGLIAFTAKRLKA